MRLLVPTLMAVLAACAPNPQGTGGAMATLPSSAGASDAPDIYREAIRRSERLGRMIYEKDMATALATQLLLDQGYLASDQQIVGWVTQEGAGSLLVTYVAERDSLMMVGHEVVFPGGLTGTPAIAPTPPDTPLTGERAVMYRARETAIAELRASCDTNYNSVVLPATMIGEQGWLVYMLAANLNPGERVLAGHALVRVSADGLVSLGATPLSLTCLISPVQVPEGTEETGLIITHLTTSWPLETHVYTSLVYGVPLYVQTRVGTWIVDGGTIELTNLTAER